jgi:GNAT superfamily N-acetyltransferase
MLRVAVEPLSSDESDFVRERLASEIAASFAPSGEAGLTASLRDGSGKLVGGLVGVTHWGWLYVRWLWVAEVYRGAGEGTKLLAAAESEARLRGCRGAYIDTFDPRARQLYERNGYVFFGELPHFPVGHSRYFLRKVFETMPVQFQRGASP